MFIYQVYNEYFTVVGLKEKATVKNRDFVL